MKSLFSSLFLLPAVFPVLAQLVKAAIQA